MDAVLDALKAAGEPTRLRILLLVARVELTTTELCRLLGQTQPRVSRHLRLLCEAGLLKRHAEGTKAFYRPASAGVGRRLFDTVLDLVTDEDLTLTSDLERLEIVRTERAEKAAQYFSSIANNWDQMRALHVADTKVEQAMLDTVGPEKVDRLLDIGTGTGRMIEIFASRSQQAIGVDLSHEMLNLARSNLDRDRFRHCSVRHGNVYALGVESQSVQVAVLHHVLHFLDEPMAAITEAARTLKPGGQLLIVDFAPHELEQLRTEHNHRRLGFSNGEVSDWCEQAGLSEMDTQLFAPAPSTHKEMLTVALWSARNPIHMQTTEKQQLQEA